jgi:two-component system, sensor histidine kinase PdtaS
MEHRARSAGDGGPGAEDEGPRLSALRRFDFIEPEPGDVVSRMVRLAAQTFATEFAALCFVEAETVRFLACHGFPAREGGRQDSVFDATIRRNDILWIENAADVEPFRRDPFVAGPTNVRFFAGTPLKTPDGFAIGALCVMDPRPRPLADLSLRGALADLASCVMSEMECWRLNREIETSAHLRSEELYELGLIYDNAPIGFALIGRDLRFRRINRLLAAINGPPVDHHIGRTVREVLPGLSDTVEPILRRIFETGERLVDVEIEGTTAREPDDSRVWMESFYPVPAVDSKVDSVAVIVRDITNERRLAARERDAASRLRRVLDGVGALIGLLEPDGRLIEANRAALDAAGLKPEDVLGKPFEETYWWAYSEAVQAQLRDAIARARAGETVRYDVPIRVAEGQTIIIDFQLVPLFDDEGRIVNLVPSAVDITERKRAEAAVEASETLFRETFEQTAVGIALVDLNGRMLRINERLCEIVGYPRDILLSKTFHEITYPSDRDPDLEQVVGLVAGTIDSYEMEKRYVRGDGSATWVHLSVSLKRNADGLPDHFIAVVEDINARKSAEARLTVVASELNHRVKNTLATFQAIVTHAARQSLSRKRFVESVTGRIRALGHAHDLLVRSQWQAVALPDMIAEELRAYGPERVIVDGPVVWLTPKAALAFGLMVHELATNAAKYGAFSGTPARFV